MQRRNARGRGELQAGCWSFVLALLTVAPLSADVFFEDDFENPDYLDEFDVADDEAIQCEGGWLFVDENDPIEASTWTGTNPLGRGNPLGEHGFPSDGLFLISDSDFGGAGGLENPPGSGMSHDAWSPVIDCTEADAVWLHFDCVAELNNNGQAIFDVDISGDDGVSWTNVFRRVAPARTAEPFPDNDNADGFIGRLHLDLTEWAAGEEIRIRWRHFEPSWDWWIAIDNVIVDDQPGPQGVAADPPEGRAVVLMATETFSGGIPDSWEIRSEIDPPNEGTETWHTTDKGGRYVPGAVSQKGVNRLGHPEPEPNFAIIDSDANPDPAENEYLLTPSIDCSCAERVFLHLKEEALMYGGMVAAEVLVSVDGGVEFEPAPLFTHTEGMLTNSFDVDEEPFYAERVFEVPVAAQESEVVFAFHFEGPGNQWWWAVDDVQVTAVDLDDDCTSCGSCVQRGFRSGGFDPATGEVAMSWIGLAGDTRHVVHREGEVIAELEGDVTTFTDNPPPLPDVECVTYRLESFAGDEPCTQCEICVPARSCPRDLRCCYDRDTGEVELSWTNGVNVDGSAWRIRRDGVPLTSARLTDSSYTDTRADPGRHEYTLELQGGNAAQCPDLPLTCSVLVPGGEILFYDDFNCYVDDGDVEDTGWAFVEENDPIEASVWTITNPFERANPPTEDGSPSTGGFLISDSDFGGAGGAVGDTPGSGMSHDLWSPEIDCSEADSVWVHFDCSAQLNNNGEVIFDVDVSTDDGAAWVNVFRRIAPGRTVAPFPTEENVDGFFGRLHIDATAAAAGESSVRFRLRQFEPNWDWWIAIDNFLVDTVPRVGGETIVFEEEFSSGIGGEWELRTPDPFGQWVGNDECFLLGDTDTSLHHFGTEYAGVCVQAVDEYLVSPILDLEEEETVWLHVKSAIHMGVTPAEILYSLDAGDTFTTLFRYDQQSLFDPLEDPFYGEYIFAVPEAAGESDVAFAFHFGGEGALVEGWWAIDDVMVTSGGPAATGVGPFVRGDCNGDGRTLGQVADAVFMLNFNFTGGPAPACLAACDVNGDGRFQGAVTDAIAILNFNFLGGPPPVAPFPECGTSDAASDLALGCETPFDCP